MSFGNTFPPHLLSTNCGYINSFVPTPSAAPRQDHASALRRACKRA